MVSHPARKTGTELKKKWQRHVVHDFAEKRNSSFALLSWYADAFAVVVSPFCKCSNCASIKSDIRCKITLAGVPVAGMDPDLLPVMPSFIS
jgi:hypothetical protein